MRSFLDIFYNFHWIEKNAAGRSSQAYAGFLGPFLRARHVRTVINLRGPNPNWRWWRAERRVCAALGIAHYDAMLSSKRLPTRKMLLTLLDAMDRAERPLLFKCSGGQDRTSLAAALYVIHTRGWHAYAAADAQFARWPYLHMPHRRQRWLRLFPIYAREAANERTLAQWIEQSYIPEEFKAWLDARGEGDSFFGLYDPALGL